MINRFKTLLQPPVFEDEAKTNLAYMFNTVMLFLIAGLIVVFIPLSLIASQPVITLLFYIIAICMLSFTLVVMRRGHVLAAGLVLIFSMWFIVTAVNMAWGGLSPRLSSYLIIIVGSAMVLGRRGVILAGILSALGTLLIYVLQTTNSLPPPAQIETPRTILGTMFIQYFIVSMILYVVIHLINRSLQQVRDSEKAVKTALKDLQTTSVSRNYINNILRSMSNFLVVIDQYGCIKTVNPATLTTLGYTEEEVVGQPFSKICIFPNNSDSDTLVIRAITDEIVYNGEATFINKIGDFVPVMLTQSMMYSDTGDFEGIVCVAKDMSEHQQAEVEKVRNAMRYRALFEQANDAIFIMNPKGEHMAANKRATDLFGYPHHTLLSMTYKDLVTTGEQQFAATILNDLKDGKRVPVYEQVMRRADGTEFTAELNIELVRDPDSNPLHIQSIVRDITERKRSEEQLAYHAGLMQNVSDAIISTDMDGVIESWNAAAEKVYGWKESEVKGKKLEDIIPMEYEGDNSKFIKSHYLRRGYWRNEVKQRRRDGEPLYVLTSTSVLRDKKNIMVGIVSVNHDITARKQTEIELQTRLTQLATLRQIDAQLNSTLDIYEVLRIGLDAVYTASKASAGFVLYHEEDETIHLIHSMGESGTVTDEIWQQGAVEVAKRQLLPQWVQSQIALPLLSKNHLIGLIILEAPTPDIFTQETFDFLKVITPRIAVAVDNARLYHVSQKQLAELQSLYDRVKNLEQLKSDMIRIGSHDLRNPIGVIKGYLEIIRSDVYPKLDAEEQDYIETIFRSVIRMEDISTDILSLERIEQTASEPFRDVFDLAAVVREVVVQTSVSAINKNLMFNVNIPEFEILVRGDLLQIREGTTNLIENAIKYTPSGGRVDMVLQLINGCAKFEVQDTGYGVPEEDQKRLFQPFFRSKSRETLRIEGNGLGLFLVKNIIERHNGRMIFKSVYQEGSTFGFELPLEGA